MSSSAPGSGLRERVDAATVEVAAAVFAERAMGDAVSAAGVPREAGACGAIRVLCKHTGDFIGLDEAICAQHELAPDSRRDGALFK